MDGAGGSGAADCIPGSIVWVRRRNGSWWPGKILGPEDLSDSHLSSPRAGTPVKLLGREDASIDWYNLERSKRVKAFRCGEFDDCIEKVESTQAVPTKKREKYASREDAILHALELEKDFSRKQGKADIANKLAGTKLSVASGRSSAVFSRIQGNGGQLGENSMPSSQINRKFAKDETPSTASYSQKGRYSNEPIQEDALLEGVPRMRGLQDFGLKIATPKRKLLSSFAGDGFLNRRTNGVHVLRVGDQSTDSTSYADGGEEAGVICRAKRSRCMYLPQDHSDFLDDRENPQRMIDVSPSTSGDGNAYPNNSLMGGSAFRLSGGGDYGSSEYYLTESEPDSSETAQNTNEETTSLSDSDFTGMHNAQERGSMSSEDPECSARSADASHRLPHDHISDSQTVSKWQLKGKRNIRNLPRRHLDSSDRNVLIGSSHRIHPSEKGMVSGQRASKWGRHVHYSDFSYSIDEADENEEYLGAHLFRDHEYPTPRFTSRDRGQSFGSPRMSDWDDIPLGGPRYDPFLIGRNPLGGGSRPVLFEVDLKVQVSYQRERVPIVSMTSKLNGSAIIGHSIQIEPIEDSSSDHLLSSNHDISEEAIYGNKRMALPPAWRTARRTANFRVPRLNPAPAFDGDEDAEGLPSMERERKSLKGAGAGAGAGMYGQKGFLVRRSLPAQQSNRRNPKKLSKRLSLSSRQKIRILSSIAGEQSFGSKCMLDRSDSGINGLIDPGSSKPTTVACIPVKLVFSRLLEKINRPPSKAVANTCRVNPDSREK